MELNITFWMHLIVAYFLIIGIGRISSKKPPLFYYLIPFFLITAIPILRIGIFNPDSFVDSDTLFYHSLVDLVMTPDAFKDDAAMQYFASIYHPVYYFFLSGFVRLGIPLPIVTKLIGLSTGIIIPLLFYYLARLIYSEDKIALVSALCSYLILPVSQVAADGLPRSIALVFYLLTLIYSFQYIKNNTFKPFILMTVCMLIILYVHVLTFLFLVIPLAVLFGFHLLRCIKFKKKFLSRPAVLLAVLSILIIFYVWFNNYQSYAVSSRSFLKKSNILWVVAADAQISFLEILRRVEFYPVILFIIYIVFKFFKKTPFYFFEKDISAIVIILLAATFILFKVDNLFYLKPHRYPLVLAIFFYLMALPLLAQGIIRWSQNKIILPVIIVFLVIPSAYFINYNLKRSLFYPEDFPNAIRHEFKLTHELTENNNVIKFKELKAASDYLRTKTTPDTIIACPIWYGDIIRLYAKRTVTSSWYIGAASVSHQKPVEIFKQAVKNSQRIYLNPDRLYTQSGATYFVLEQDAFPLFDHKTEEVFSGRYIKVLKILE